MKEYFVNGVLQIPDVKINGYTGYDSAPHIVSVSVRGVRSEVLLHALEDKGIYDKIKTIKAKDWTEEFANEVYDNVKKHKYSYNYCNY